MKVEVYTWLPNRIDISHWYLVNVLEMKLRNGFLLITTDRDSYNFEVDIITGIFVTI